MSFVERTDSVGELPRTTSIMKMLSPQSSTESDGLAFLAEQATLAAEAPPVMRMSGLSQPTSANKTLGLLPSAFAQAPKQQLSQKVLQERLRAHEKDEEEEEEEEEEEDYSDDTGSYSAESREAGFTELSPPLIGQYSSDFAAAGSVSRHTPMVKPPLSPRRPGRKMTLIYDNWPPAIVALPCKEFHAFIKKERLSAEQIRDLKRVRRREQGKRAARTSRRRAAERRIMDENNPKTKLPRETMKTLLDQHRMLEEKVSKLLEFIQTNCSQIPNSMEIVKSINDAPSMSGSDQ